MARPPTVLCVYLLSTPNDSGRVVMRLDMVYAPSSINYNLYPPSYIPPSIQTNFVFPYSVPPTIPWTDTICDFQNSCKKSQNVTSKIAVKSHKMWLVIRYKRSMLSDCIQCWSQLTAHCCCSKRIACSPSPPPQLSSQQSLTCSSQVLFLKKLSFHCIGFFWFSRDRTICGQAPDIRLTGRLLLHARCIVL